MKIIEDYLNTLYSEDDSMEVQDLKEELKEHLLSTVNEFINQGYDIDVAQNKAIEQFDDGSESSVELRSIYNKKFDVNKERLKKLSSIRWKLLNAFGLFLATSFYLAAFSPTIPLWLISIVVLLGLILVILSVMISILKKNL